MTRISASRPAAIGCFLVIFGAAFLPLSAASDTDTPQQLISKARDSVSLKGAGSVEIQAEIRVATPNGELKGTYTLDWAAPDLFRREIHLPGYDEISVANGTTMYRKRNTNFTPLAVFRVEELMNPEHVVADIQRDSNHPAAPSIPGITESQQANAWSKLTELTMTDSSGRKTIRILIPSNFYEDIWIDAKHGWPVRIARRSTADDETVRYGDYKPLGPGFLPIKRQYFNGGRFLVAVDVKQVRQVTGFPPDMFVAPPEAERLDWCDDQIPAERLPIVGPLPIDPQTFQNSEILDAFVNADGTASHLEIIGTAGPSADAAIETIANLIRFTAASCGGKSVKSEIPVVIGELDIANAAFANETDIHLAGKNGYTRPTCVRCPQPQYSDAAFHEKVQGSMVLSVMVMPDGQTRSIHVLKELGHGLDQKAVDAVLHWQFKPATGPDGKPAAVRMLIEIDFHLY